MVTISFILLYFIVDCYLRSVEYVRRNDFSDNINFSDKPCQGRSHSSAKAFFDALEKFMMYDDALDPRRYSFTTTTNSLR